MRYAYFPGCSLQTVATAYDRSLRLVFERLGAGLEELDDWNCCGATAYMGVAETLALAVCARNLALAERAGGGRDLVAPCSACYLVLQKTNRFLSEQPALRARVDEALAEADLSYRGGVRIRHPLDVLVNDIGIDAIAAKVVRPLAGARIAPYYGCQLVRPERGFDDREAPLWMDELFRRCGATVVDFTMKVRCCGGMLMTTAAPVGRQLSGEILAEALEEGANVVVTTCPLCQMNLEAYQKPVGRTLGRPVRIPVVFFTQLLGLALGASEREVALHRNLVPLEPGVPALAEAAHG